jgi:hypothetical protein
MVDPQWIHIEGGKRIGAMCGKCGRVCVSGVFIASEEEALRTAWMLTEECCIPPEEKVCSRCGAVGTYSPYTVCLACSRQSEAEKEAAKFNAARKLTLAELEAETPGAMLTLDGERWHSSFDDLVEEQYENDCSWELPEYIWATEPRRMHFDASDMVESACDEELYEDAWDAVAGEAVAELQAYLDKWCDDHTPTSWWQDYGRVIVFSAEERAMVEARLKEWRRDDGYEEDREVTS